MAKAGDGDGSVVVLPHMGDYPVRGQGPRVDPGHRAAAPLAALGDNGGPEGDEREREQGERELARRRGAGEEALDDVLVARRAVVPPLKVRRQEKVHRLIIVVVVIEGLV